MKRFRSGVVLLELMASILIFAMAGAVCVQVLMKADEMAERSRRLNDGVRYASSAAELIRASDSTEIPERILKAWPQARIGEQISVALEGGELRVLPAKAAEEAEGLLVYQIQWVVSEEILYELEIYRSTGGGAE